MLTLRTPYDNVHNFPIIETDITHIALSPQKEDISGFQSLLEWNGKVDSFTKSLNTILKCLINLNYSTVISGCNTIKFV